MALIFIGKKIPRSLIREGWREVSAMHIGNGIWFFRLEKFLDWRKKK